MAKQSSRDLANELTSAECGDLRTAPARHSGVGVIVITGFSDLVTAAASSEGEGVVLPPDVGATRNA